MHIFEVVLHFVYKHQVGVMAQIALRDELRRMWTNEMEAYFIELIAPHKHLWDYTNEYFKKNKLKLVTYDHIRNLMLQRYPAYAHILTNDNLIKKFQNLRGYYRREKKKLTYQEKDVKDMNIGPGTITSGWVHFERLSFLDDVTSSLTDDPEKQSPPASDNSLSLSNEEFVVKTEIIEAEEYPEENVEDYILPRISTDLSLSLQNNTSPVDHDMGSPTSYTESPARDTKSPIHKDSKNFKHKDMNSTTDDFEKDKNTQNDCEPSNSCSQSKSKKRKQEDADIQEVIKCSLSSAHDALEKLKQRKETLDNLFSDYVGMTLAEIPPSKAKEQAKIQILEILLKLKYSSE